MVFILINFCGNYVNLLIPYHEKAIELDSTFHYAWMAKGRALTRLNRAEEALEYIETSIELEAEDPDYHEALARCYIELGLFDKARQILNLGLSVDGQHVSCWVALGDVNYNIGNKIQALQCYDEAVIAQDVLSRNRMRDLDWIEKGRILDKAGVIHEGFRQHNNAISVASDTSRPYFRKAKLLIKYDKIDEARVLVDKGLAIDSESITGNRLLIKIMDSSEIFSDLETRFDIFKRNSAVSSLLGLKLINDYPEKAIDYLSDQNHEDLILKSQALKKLTKNEEAIFSAEKAIKLKPNNIEGWILCGWCHFELNNYQESEKYFEGALGCDINNPEALLGKALILKSQKKDYSYYNRALKSINSDLSI